MNYFSPISLNSSILPLPKHDEFGGVPPLGEVIPQVALEIDVNGGPILGGKENPPLPLESFLVSRPHTGVLKRDGLFSPHIVKE